MAYSKKNQKDEKRVLNEENVSVTVNLYEENGMVAFISLELFELIVLKGLTVREMKDGNWFLAYPSHKGKDDKYYNDIYLLDKDEKEWLQDYVCECVVECQQNKSKMKGKK